MLCCVDENVLMTARPIPQTLYRVCILHESITEATLQLRTALSTKQAQTAAGLGV